MPIDGSYHSQSGQCWWELCVGKKHTKDVTTDINLVALGQPKLEGFETAETE